MLSSIVLRCSVKFVAIVQRWSPRGYILKCLASKVKSLTLASRPQVLENWPVLGLRTALFFELLKFCRTPEKKFYKAFFTGERLKNFFEDLFFWDRLKNFFGKLFFENTCACVLGLEHSCPWPREGLSSKGLSLASSIVSSTPPLLSW